MPNQDSWSFYRDESDEWRWERIASDYEVVGVSAEGFADRMACVANAERHGYSLDEWEFFEDAFGQFRWRRRTADNEIVGAAPAGFANPSDCLANAMRHGYDGTL